METDGDGLSLEYSGFGVGLVVSGYGLGGCGFRLGVVPQPLTS